MCPHSSLWCPLVVFFLYCRVCSHTAGAVLFGFQCVHTYISISLTHTYNNRFILLFCLYHWILILRFAVSFLYSVLLFFHLSFSFLLPSLFTESQSLCFLYFYAREIRFLDHNKTENYSLRKWYTIWPYSCQQCYYYYYY